MVVPLLLALVVILAAAKLGGWLSHRSGQPPVLGELVAGIVLGNLSLLGIQAFEPLRSDALLAALAELGVIVLLFDVGLESTVSQMMKVGASAFLVALLGVVTPFGLGWAAGAWLLPDKSVYVHIFLGAVLTATSVGITARVLRDLGQIRSDEAKIILGAAVIDDVLGLVILAVVSGIITGVSRGGGGSSAGSILWIAGKALLFLVLAIAVGSLVMPRALRWISKLRVQGILLTTGLIFCFLLAYLAARVGLAPIVGAFAAGLILEPASFEAFEERRQGHSLRSLVDPIAIVLVPLFFVRTGFLVDLRSFGDARIVALAAALTLVAWIGKQACMLGVLQRGVNRLAIGFGMVPRGEVGLIFANIGSGLILGGAPIITPPLYAAVVIMVIATTLVTPPLLQWSLTRRRGRTAAVRKKERSS